MALAKATWKEELLKVCIFLPLLIPLSLVCEDFPVPAQMEKTWERRLEEARRENHRQTAEATCQAAEPETSRRTVTVEELDSRLRAQKEQLHLEADKVKHKAVEEARKQTQKQLHKKHLEDMAKQVRCSCAVIRPRWLQEGTWMCLDFRWKVRSHEHITAGLRI